MQVLERDIEKGCVRWVEQFGFHCFKLNMLGYVGFPDRIIFGPEKFILFVEFKRPGKQPDGSQRRIHKMLRRFGFEVWVMDNIDEFQRWFAEFTGNS